MSPCGRVHEPSQVFMRKNRDVLKKLAQSMSEPIWLLLTRTALQKITHL